MYRNFFSYCPYTPQIEFQTALPFNLSYSDTYLLYISYTQLLQRNCFHFSCRFEWIQRWQRSPLIRSTSIIVHFKLQKSLIRGSCNFWLWHFFRNTKTMFTLLLINNTNETAWNFVIIAQLSHQWPRDSVLRTGRLEVPASIQVAIRSFLWFSPKCAKIWTRIHKKDSHGEHSPSCTGPSCRQLALIPQLNSTVTELSFAHNGNHIFTLLYICCCCCLVFFSFFRFPFFFFV